jgi:hypothetical protein
MKPLYNHSPLLRTLMLIGVLTHLLFAQEENGTIVSVRNHADACAANVDCRRLDFGSHVVEGDSLKTFDRAELVVRFNSGSRAQMGPNSVLVLAEMKKNGKKTIARWGEFDFDVKQKDSKGRFQVRTPVAVAGAEGTRFRISVDEITGSSIIELEEGSLQVNPTQGKGSGILLKPGQKLQVLEATTVPAPTNFSADRVSSANQNNSLPVPDLPTPSIIIPPPATEVPPAFSLEKGTLHIQIQGVP